MTISFETPDFTYIQKSIDQKSKEKYKKMQNEDPRINEIIDRIGSSNDAYDTLEECVKWKTLEPSSPVPD